MCQRIVRWLCRCSWGAPRGARGGLEGSTVQEAGVEAGLSLLSCAAGHVIALQTAGERREEGRCKGAPFGAGAVS